MSTRRFFFKSLGSAFLAYQLRHFKSFEPVETICITTVNFKTTIRWQEGESIFTEDVIHSIPYHYDPTSKWVGLDRK